KCAPAKIRFSFRALNAIEKRRKVDQLCARLHEIEVENLLASHGRRIRPSSASHKRIYAGLLKQASQPMKNPRRAIEPPPERVEQTHPRREQRDANEQHENIPQP